MKCTEPQSTVSCLLFPPNVAQLLPDHTQWGTERSEMSPTGAHWCAGLSRETSLPGAQSADVGKIATSPEGNILWPDMLPEVPRWRPVS